MNTTPTSEQNPPLPPVQTAELDAEMLEAVLRDIEQCTELLEAVFKGAPGQRATAPMRVTENVQAMRKIRFALHAGGAAGVQLRYRHDGAEWWDTLMRGPNGFRLVRMQLPKAA